MSKKLKYALGGIGFLAVGGTLYPVLKGSLGFNTLKGLKGGSFNSRAESSRNDYRLNLEGNRRSSLLDLKKGPNSLQEMNLELNGESSIFSLFGESINKNHSDFVSSIFGEIFKETKTKSLDEKVNTKYEELAKKYLEEGGGNRNTMLKNFQTAALSIKRWLDSKSKPKYKAPDKALTKEERVSLQKFYELWYELSNQGKGFSSELNEFSGESGEDYPNQPKSSVPKLSHLQKALKVINWGQKKINVQPTVSTRYLRADAWGPWEQNPYKHFYQNEREFQRHLSGVNRSSAQIAKLKQAIDRESGMWGGIKRAQQTFQAQKEQVKELQANQTSEIEHHVGSKLLEFMNR